jgi:hypothetical protein
MLNRTDRLEFYKLNLLVIDAFSHYFRQFKFFEDIYTQDSEESFYSENGTLEIAKEKVLSRTYI